MRHTAVKTNSPKAPEDPRASAVKRLLEMAQMIRRKGTPDEADEALEWEKQLERRLKEIETTSMPQAA